MTTNIATLFDIFSAHDSHANTKNRRQTARRSKRDGNFYDDRRLNTNQGIRAPKGWNTDYPNIERLMADM